MFELVDGQDFREFRNPTASVLYSYLKFSESSDAKISFYGRVDFENEGTEGWRFLEKELLLPSSIDDERDMKRTQEFVNNFTPIAINVEGDYAFLLTDKSGQIFESVSPDLEEVSLVATSLSQLVIRLQTETKILPLSLFVRTWLGKGIINDTGRE